MTKEKQDDIRKMIRKGLPEGEIKNQLKEEGVSDDEIKELFKPKNYDMISWYLISAIIFLLAAIWFANLLFAAASAIMFSVYYNERQKNKKKDLQ